jgi:hypothetical protein
MVGRGIDIGAAASWHRRSRSWSLASCAHVPWTETEAAVAIIERAIHRRRRLVRFPWQWTQLCVS